MKRVESALIAVVCLFLALLFLYLSGYALAYTSVIAEDSYLYEPIVEKRDDLLRGVLLLLVGLTALWLFGKVEKRIPMRLAVSAAVCWALAAGAFWVCATRTVIRSDSDSIAFAAMRIIRHDYSEVKSIEGYINQHPHQTGFLLVSEIFQRIFGSRSSLPIQLFMVLCLGCAYAGALRLTWQATGNERITRYAALLLVLCIQPVLYGTFVYGNILSIACALWAASILLDIVKGGSKWLFLLGGLFCGVSVLVKPNGWIPVLALTIVALLWLISEKKWRVLPLLAVLILGSLLTTGGVKAFYTARSGGNLNNGVPMTAYLAMGLQEGQRAPGWYNGYVDKVYEANQYNTKLTSEKALSDIRMHLDVFCKNPAYAASFFHRKTMSQWNEPTFESIWVTRVCEYDQQNRLPFADAVLNGNLREPIESWMEWYIILLYLCFALGAGGFAFKLLRGSEPVSRACGFGMGFLAVTIIGAFLYHTLFEAKSQYLFVYLPVMIPLAASAAARLRVPSFKRRNPS